MSQNELRFSHAGFGLHLWDVKREFSESEPDAWDRNWVQMQAAVYGITGRFQAEVFLQASDISRMAVDLDRVISGEVEEARLVPSEPFLALSVREDSDRYITVVKVRERAHHVQLESSVSLTTDFDAVSDFARQWRRLSEAVPPVEPPGPDSRPN